MTILTKIVLTINGILAGILYFGWTASELLECARTLKTAQNRR